MTGYLNSSEWCYHLGFCFTHFKFLSSQATSSDLCSLEDTLAKYRQNKIKSRVTVFKRHSGTYDGYRTKVAGGEKSLDQGRNGVLGFSREREPIREMAR